MSDKKISELVELTTPASGDLLPIVDISDTTQGLSGSTKKITTANLATIMASNSFSTIAVSGQSDVVADSSTDTLTLVGSGVTITTNATTDTITFTSSGGVTQPLMNYGGYGFDGSTDYLDTNALTGIVDGKKGTMVFAVRFANNASATEVVFQNTGNAFFLQRSSAGTLQFQAENAAGTQIMFFTSAAGACATAGTYIIMASWDLATPGSGRLYINDVSSYVETTFTNDTIDYTVTEWALGATVSGANFLTGDIYTVWFDATTNLEFNTESVRRKFINSSSTPLFLGSNGELPTGTKPILFLCYDDYTRWAKNRGSATSTFTEKGTPSAATTILYGQYQDLSGYYTPTLTNTTNVAASTAYKCRWSRTGNFVTVFGKVDIDPTSAANTVLGISLPFATNITALEDVAGTAVGLTTATIAAAIHGNIASDRAELEYVAVDTANKSFYFQFSYEANL